MLINNWYVAAYSSEVVTGKPLGVKMLGCDFVLFRNMANEAVCLSDVCCHRGASLSRGKIVGDGCAVACPFHGWEFESNGHCTRIPSMDDVMVPKRARVDSYPTYERYDWVWVFLGDLPEDKRPPVPDMLPEFRSGLSQIVYSTTTPIDQYTSRLFSIQARNYAIEADHDQENLNGPKGGPTPISDEFLIEADGMEASFRRTVTQLIEKGWEIDVRKVAEDYDRKVYVIPSPGRRRDPGNWVHEAIPTTRPRTEDEEFILI